ncbi:MAG: L-threonylcarbamoyladenylate synthase [Clostridia bacterium]|nr:L-threonylcarbamoyladenylate synthase [Clostridia bacterium]
MPDTKLFSTITQPDNGTRLAGQVIRQGGLVAFPTETVYGLGANGLDPDAVMRIFEAKGRPQDNPLILHVARKSDVKQLWRRVPDTARALMDEFWPGPLTLVCARSGAVPDEVTAGLDTVAVRMSDNKTALAFIRAAGVPIAAPSANTSGKPSPTCAQHVIDDLWGKVDVILDGGQCRIGMESTVLLLAKRPVILRPGAVTREQIESRIGAVEVAPSVLSPLAEGERAASPGMKYRHYAPDAQVIVASGTPSAAAGIIRREYDRAENDGRRCIILASRETQPFYRGRKCDIIGSSANMEEMCANLFSALRRYSGSADVIFAESVSTDELGLAYMNRLLRASGFTILNR